MLQEKSIILPYREFAIATKRLLSPYRDLLIVDGDDALELLSAGCVEWLFHQRVLTRFAWRTPEAGTKIAFKAAFHKFDSFKDAETNAEIILEPVIESIESLLNTVMPHRTFDVFTVERAFGELVLTNHGDYRVLKFMAENPNWKPTLEEPETLVLESQKHTKFPAY